MTVKSVACIVVNYRSPYEMLRQCLESVATSADVDCNIILVDNCSGDDVIDRLQAGMPGVNVIALGDNAGFAAAVNLGMTAVKEKFVLFLNPDAVLTDTALSLMVDALEAAGDSCAGVAPKMMSSVNESVIDAIGTVMPPDGASFNRGIGQCDLGQYDRQEEVFGTCFGATLLRAKLFQPDRVGPLYEGYFLYFEDSDWCMRARSQGYRFLTAPDSLVYHLHSGITRYESLSFKYRLIELNTLKIVVRTFESPLRAAKIVFARCVRLLARTFIRRKFIHENLSSILSFVKAMPGLLRERRALKRRRVASDREIFEFAAGEYAFFDTVNYQPERFLDSLISSFQHLWDLNQDPTTRQILNNLQNLRDKYPAGANVTIDESMLEQLAGDSDCVRNFLRQHIATNQIGPFD